MLLSGVPTDVFDREEILSPLRGRTPRNTESIYRVFFRKSIPYSRALCGFAILWGD